MEVAHEYCYALVSKLNREIFRVCSECATPSLDSLKKTNTSSIASCASLFDLNVQDCQTLIKAFFFFYLIQYLHRLMNEMNKNLLHETFSFSTSI
ncbi:hypothetical protein Scep_025600 [Stephania cephalantha]|uniref:Uncharacterized protein n=1 Tax=Stephania cephalantha TaxID=152367 RepID=A0AAP0EII5_9MAGN